MFLSRVNEIIEKHENKGSLLRQSGATIEELLRGRGNSFTMVRTLLATLVIVDHSFPIGGFNGGVDPLWSLTKGQVSSGSLAVDGFFAVSGFLVTGSLLNSRSLSNYLWKRFLRIVPAFWVCILVTALAIAPVAWLIENGHFAGYFSYRGPSNYLAYIRNNFLLSIRQWNINGLLTKVPYDKTKYAIAFDGSLWTLIYEFKSYLVLGAVGLITQVKKGRGLALVTLSLIFLVSTSAYVLGDFSATMPSVLFISFRDVQWPGLMSFFSAGSILYLISDKVRVSWYGILTASVLVAISLFGRPFALIGPFFLTYGLISLALMVDLSLVDRVFGDASYGIYIYAFPVGQVLAELRIYEYGLPIFAIVTLLISSSIALASWHFVEHPLQRFKRLF